MPESEVLDRSKSDAVAFDPSIIATGGSTLKYSVPKANWELRIPNPRALNLTKESTLSMRLFSNVGKSIVVAIYFSIGAAAAQTPNDFEARRTAAYQKFHDGKAQTAATELLELVSVSSDKIVKAHLLRDVTEICATARDFDCSLNAELAAYELIKDDETLKFLFPELFAYLINAQVWFGNKDFLEKQIGPDGFIKTTTAMTNAKAALVGNIALHNYLVSKGDFRSAENAYSSTLLSLLMFDPKNKYDISCALVRMIGLLISEQDLVGALALAVEVDQYITKNLNHKSIPWAEYKLNVAQLFAFLNRHQQAASALAESSALIKPLEISEHSKSYYLTSNSSLQALALILDGKTDDAVKAQQQNRMQTERSAIIERGEFQSLQEMYFALSELIVGSAVDKSKVDPKWEPLFRKPIKWQLDGIFRNNIESYRLFGLAIVTALNSEVEAVSLFRAAAKLRVDNFEEVQKSKFEGFQLPSSLDLAVISSGISTVGKQDSEQLNLILRGGEILSRTVRQQLSDFAILIGSQKTDATRNTARSTLLLVRQKQNWEIQQIRRLLAEEPLERGAILGRYSELVGQVNKLKHAFSMDLSFSKTSAYPTVKEMQDALRVDEVFVSYFPTLQGLGKLCVNKSGAFVTAKKYDPAQVTLEIRLLRNSLTADYAPDPKLDSQFPVDAALHLNEVLFSGLEKCITEGALINISLPEDVSGIPLAALLKSSPPLREEGYDLRKADWVGNHFSFASTVSARHFIGTHQPYVPKLGSKPYLGVGDPNLKPSDLALLARGVSATPTLEDEGQISKLLPLPETKSELQADLHP